MVFIERKQFEETCTGFFSRLKAQDAEISLLDEIIEVLKCCKTFKELNVHLSKDRMKD